MQNNLIYLRTFVYNINYHVAWSIKGKKKILTPQIEAEMQSIALDIAKEKGFSVHQEVKYLKPSKRALELYKKRKNCVSDFLHKATTYIKNYCVNHDIHTIIIGDITGIRKK